MEHMDFRQLCAFADVRETNCVLLLREPEDGLWQIDALGRQGKRTTMHVCTSLTAVLQTMDELYRRSAVPRRQHIRIAFARDDLWQAAKLAGHLGTDAELLPLEDPQTRLALLYTGTIRTDPLV